jgi:general secretion pathway protein G
MSSSRHLQNGFPCIEIMAFIVVLGLLATILVQNLPGRAAKAKRTKAQADIAELKIALDRYHDDNGYYRPPIKVFARWSRGRQMA